MEKEPLRTGIFGGSFNPVHIGHLALANYLCEYGEVDEVWLLVSPQNPFKQQSELLDDHTRLELVQKAVAGYSRFRASDFEFSLPRPSYTIHTLQALSAAYPEREFYLIIGADNWQAFQKWKSPEVILEQYHLLIYPRQGYTLMNPASRHVSKPYTVPCWKSVQLSSGRVWHKEKISAISCIRKFTGSFRNGNFTSNSDRIAPFYSL